MICGNCNKEIEEGATYCMECGAPVDEPVVLKTIKTAPSEAAKKSEEKNEGPIIDLGGYVKALGNDTAALIGLVGAVLVYLSSFFTWMWQKLGDNEIVANLFELGGKNGDLALGAGSLIFFAILIMLSAVDMLAFSACQYVRPIKDFSKNYIVKAIPVAVVIILLLLVNNNKNYEQMRLYIDSQKEIAEALGKQSNYSGGIGAGPIMAIVGTVLYAVSVFLDFSKRNKK